MGMQSATVYRLSVPGVSTTYVTGTLTTLAMRLVCWLRSSAGSAAAPADRGMRRLDQTALGQGPGLPAAVWLAYGAGAVAAGSVYIWLPSVALPVVAGTVVELRWPSMALLLTIFIVAAVIAVAVVRYRHRP